MEQLLVGKLGRENVEDARVAVMKTERVVFGGRDEEIELGKIAHRIARRELVKQLLGICPDRTLRYLGKRLAVRQLKTLPIRHQVFLVIRGATYHIGNAAGSDGRTPREQAGQHIDSAVVEGESIGILLV